MDAIKNKRILITGPARGIGAETARQLAAQGARLALVGLEPELLQKLATELGQDHFWFECDVTDYASLEKAVEKTVSTFGGLDVVICNAGIGPMGTVAVSSAAVLAKTIEVNLIGVINTVSAAMPAMIESRGYYLMVSSASAILAMPGATAYSASKIAVEHFSDSLRVEVAHKGIGVGVAFPAWVDTDLIRDQHQDLETFEDLIRNLPGPFGGVTTVEECAAAFVKAIAYRKRKIFIPGILGFASVIRQVFKSYLWESWAIMQGKPIIIKAEAEVRALGRYFGKNSVGTKLLERKKPQ
jgi:NAD(P)-dependent dehydrogenase (short-subunit alcohol dehydrogenase family)